MSALVAGNALDRLIGEKVMGWDLLSYEDGDPWTKEGLPTDDGWYWDGRDQQEDREAWAWHPSMNIAHAWEVVIHMSKRSYDKDAPATWWNTTSGNFITVEGFNKTLATIMHDQPEDMPLAICLAALAVVGHERG